MPCENCGRIIDTNFDAEHFEECEQETEDQNDEYEAQKEERETEQAESHYHPSE